MADNYISAKSVSRKTIVSRQWNTMVLLGIPCHGPDINVTLGAVVEGRASRFVSVRSRVPLGPVLVFAFIQYMIYNIMLNLRFGCLPTTACCIMCVCIIVPFAMYVTTLPFRETPPSHVHYCVICYYCVLLFNFICYCVLLFNCVCMCECKDGPLKITIQTWHGYHHEIKLLLTYLCSEAWGCFNAQKCNIIWTGKESRPFFYRLDWCIPTTLTVASRSQNL